MMMIIIICWLLSSILIRITDDIIIPPKSSSFILATRRQLLAPFDTSSTLCDLCGGVLNPTNWQITNNLQQLIIDQIDPSKQIISKLFWFETQTFQWCALHATRTPSPWAAPLPCKHFLNTWPWQKIWPLQKNWPCQAIFIENHLLQSYGSVREPVKNYLADFVC